MCCCKPYEETLNSEINKKITFDKMNSQREKNILVIGSNSCSTFFQIQKYYNMQYDRAAQTYNDKPDDEKQHEDTEAFDQKLNILIDGFINNFLSLLSWNIIPSEIYQLIWKYFPKNRCLITSKDMVSEHRYTFQSCIFCVAHIHEMNANIEFLNKIIHHYSPFDNFSCIVYSVSLLTVQTSDKFIEAIKLFNMLINHRSFQCICMVLWFEDYYEFVTKINDKIINMNELYPGNYNEMCDDNKQEEDNAFDYIQNLFLNCNPDPNCKQIYVYSTGKPLYWRTNKPPNFVNTWWDIHYLLIGMSLTRGSLI